MPLVANISPSDEMVHPYIITEEYIPHSHTLRYDEIEAIIDEIVDTYPNRTVYMSEYTKSIRSTTQTFRIQYYESIVKSAHYRENIHYIDPVTYEQLSISGEFELVRKFSARLNFFQYDVVEIVYIFPVEFLREVKTGKIIFECERMG